MQTNIVVGMNNSEAIANLIQLSVEINYKDNIF